MSINEKLMNMKKILVKKNKSLEESKNENMKLDIPNDDKIKLLTALYIFNHENKVCMPFEYCYKAGSIENGGGDYAVLENQINALGYNVKEIVFVNKIYKLVSANEAFEERKKSKTFFPNEVKYFVLSNKEAIEFPLVETPETLEFLAKSGDVRAIGTYNNWIKKVHSFDSIINNENKVKRK